MSKFCEVIGKVCVHLETDCEMCSVKYPKVAENREAFRDYWSLVDRVGVERFLEWLDTTDFYTAPCSTRFHLSRVGGLCEHSLNVLVCLEESIERLKRDISLETAIICALGHDLCKADFYGVEMRNKKENGKWVQKPVFIVQDKFPYGHGEKSVAILMRFMGLTVEEQLAIRWHMGGFTSGMQDYGTIGAFSEACKQSVLVPMLHMADFEATNVVESRG